jgi:methylthioribulose-1-phosphate dehydratase
LPIERALPRRSPRQITWFSGLRILQVRSRHGSPTRGLEPAARQLTLIGRQFYDRNWVLGTSGNFSVVLSRRPLRLAITASSAHKGRLTPRQVFAIDRTGKVVGKATGRPSAETHLHLEIVQTRAAGAVLHTHSVWGTILSDHHAHEHGLAIAGFEMLKGLDGVQSHEHREWIPIVENDQDMVRLSAVVRSVLLENPQAHAFLIRGHGLYTWGRTLDEAARHVEILEFLLETVARRSQPWQ